MFGIVPDRAKIASTPRDMDLSDLVRAVGLLRMWKYHCEIGDRTSLAAMVGITDEFLKEIADAVDDA